MKTILALAVLALTFSSPSMADEKKKPAPRQMSSFDELDAAGIGAGYQQGGKQATIDDLIKQGRFEYVDAPTGGLDGARFYEQAPTPPEPPKRELGPIDRWRYDSCRTEASKAPTKEGVRSGLQVCHEKFGQ